LRGHFEAGKEREKGREGGGKERKEMGKETENYSPK